LNDAERGGLRAGDDLGTQDQALRDRFAGDARPALAASVAPVARGPTAACGRSTVPARRHRTRRTT